MTELNESLAIFMGWEYHPDDGRFPWWGEGIDHRCDVSAWSPTTDLNQAALVIKKLGEMGKGADFAHTAWVISDAGSLIDSGRGYGCSCSEDFEEVFDLFKLSAEQLCLAAEKVIKGGEDGNRAE